VSAEGNHASNDMIACNPCGIVMKVETEALRWFQQVAEGVTVTEVGELYRVTQSGVSRGLARLELEVGTPLLRRSGRTLRMTHAGAVFKRHVDALLYQLDDGLAAITELIDPDTGTVTLAFQLSLGTWLVPHLISAFRAGHPGVRFVLQQARDELVSSVLDGGRVDLEITALRPTDRTVRWHRLLTEPLCAVVPAGHRLAGSGRLGVAELAGEAFVMLRPTSLLRRQVAQLCERAGFRPAVAFEGDDLPTVRAFVAAGLGVAVVPAPRSGSPEAAATGVRHRPLSDPGATREVGLAWSAERRILPAADMFRRYTIAAGTAAGLPPPACPAPAVGTSGPAGAGPAGAGPAGAGP
jgi:LysR family transcriptional activator of glutamate synthase operon